MSRSEPPTTRGFLVGLVIGTTMIAFGIGGLVSTTSTASAFDVGTWVVGADLAHDLVLAPIAVICSILITRLVPRPWRTPIRSALIASAVFTIIAYPALRGFGRATAPGNPSVQPLDYPTALATAIGAAWAIAAVWLAAIAVRRRRSRPRDRMANAATARPEVEREDPR